MFLQNSAIWSDEDGGGAGGDSGDGVFSSAGGSDVVRKPILVEVAPVPTPFPPSVSLLVMLLFAKLPWWHKFWT